MRNFFICVLAFNCTILQAQPGTLDSSFGDQGYANGCVVDNENSHSLHAVAVQGDGRIVIAGYVLFPDFMSRPFVARMMPDGTMDPSFGNNGVVHETTGSSKQLYDVAIDPDGKIVVCGAVSPTNSTALQNAYIARYNVDGTADATFGNSGSRTVELSTSTDYLLRFIARPDGRYQAIARSGPSSATDACVLMFTSTGQLDNTFSGDGKLCGLFGGALPQGVGGITMRPDGAALIAGAGGGANRLAAILGNGSYDPAFGSGGIRELTVMEAPGGVTGMAVRPDGSILCSGDRTTVAPRSLFVTRLFSNGDIDAGFGGSGTVQYFDTELIGASVPTAPLFMPDGSVLMGWRSFNEGDFSVVITRFTPSGLSADWTSRLDVGSEESDQDFAVDIALAPNGEVVLGCTYTTAALHRRISILRFIGYGTTGLNAIESHQFTIAPNPARSHVNVRLNDLDQAMTVSLYDATGRLVQSVSGGGLQQVDIDVSSLKPGPYIVEVRSVLGSSRMPLVIEP